MPQPYLIALCHAKGGVAKTTTALALGACFAEGGLHTLLIDLDPSANLTCGMGLSPKEIRKSATDILLGNDLLSSVAHPTAILGLDIVPANPEMATAARFLSLRPNYETILRNLFTPNGSGSRDTRLAAHSYDIVLMDCPPSLGPLAVAALSAAHLALIPTPCEYYSLQALEGLFGVIKATRARTNPQLAYRLVVTMFDRRGSLHTRVLALLQEQMPGALCETQIGFDSKIRESQLMGVPITIHAPHTRAAQQYHSLASEISQLIKGLHPEKQAAGAPGWLTESERTPHAEAYPEPKPA